MLILAESWPFVNVSAIEYIFPYTLCSHSTFTSCQILLKLKQMKNLHVSVPLKERILAASNFGLIVALYHCFQFQQDDFLFKKVII